MRMGIRTVGWLLVLMLAVGQSSALAAADYFGQVTFNGLPVPGATVTATQSAPATSPERSPSTPVAPSGTSPATRDSALETRRKATATTNADGIYHLADLAEGLWTLTIELFGFATITREIAIPTKEDPPPDALTVRSFDELTRALPQARTFEPVASESAPNPRRNVYSPFRAESSPRSTISH